MHNNTNYYDFAQQGYNIAQSLPHHSNYWLHNRINFIEDKMTPQPMHFNSAVLVPTHIIEDAILDYVKKTYKNSADLKVINVGGFYNKQCTATVQHTVPVK